MTVIDMKTIKKLTATMTAILLAAACLSACQPTPTLPPIDQKGGDYTKASSAPEGKYQAPDTWKETIHKEGSNLYINVDAKLEVPDTAKYPVVKVKQAKFTEEDARKLAEVFFKNKAIYSNGITQKELDRVKAYCNQQIEKYEQLINSDPSKKSKYEFVISCYQSEITMYESNKIIEKNLPGSFEFKKSEVGSYGHVSEDITLKADLGQKSFAMLQVSNNSNDFYSESVVYFYSDSWPYTEFMNEDKCIYYSTPNIKTTKEQAIKKAKKALEELGLSYMDVVEVRTGGEMGMFIGQNEADRQGYIIYCTRKIGEVPISLSEYESIGDNYTKQTTNEMIKICVDDTGVTDFIWRGPYEVIDQPVDNVKLLPFSSIKEQFKKYASKYESILSREMGIDPYSNERIDFRVNRITLSYMRILVRDNKDEFLLIPVWDFYGSRIVDGKEVLGFSPNHSILTINAIDGTIVDRYKGY